MISTTSPRSLPTQDFVRVYNLPVLSYLLFVYLFLSCLHLSLFHFPFVPYFPCAFSTRPFPLSLYEVDNHHLRFGFRQHPRRRPPVSPTLVCEVLHKFPPVNSSSRRPLHQFTSTQRAQSVRCLLCSRRAAAHRRPTPNSPAPVQIRLRANRSRHALRRSRNRN